MGQSSLAGGSLNSALSHISAARSLHSFLCFGQWFFWQLALQYLTTIHDLHALSLITPPPSPPHSAQQLVVIILNCVEFDRQQDVLPAKSNLHFLSLPPRHLHYCSSSSYYFVDRHHRHRSLFPWSYHQIILGGRRHFCFTIHTYRRIPPKARRARILVRV